MKIEIELPDGIDTRQLYTHVVDAIGINDNITEEEYHALKKIMETIRDARKEFLVWHKGIITASSQVNAERLAKALGEHVKLSDYRFIESSVHPVLEDAEVKHEYFVDGYENKEPFSVFHVKPFYLTKREYEMALIPDNPKSNITITKTYKKWDAQ